MTRKQGKPDPKPEIEYKAVQAVQEHEHCLIQLGTAHYAVLKISHLKGDRYLLRVRGSDGQTIRMYVSGERLLAVVSEAFYEVMKSL